jgi:hypothetical protein
MLFQHQVCSHLFMVLFCGGFFVSSKSTLVAKNFFSGFLCCVQVSSCFFFRAFGCFHFNLFSVVFCC